MALLHFVFGAKLLLMGTKNSLDRGCRRKIFIGSPRPTVGALPIRMPQLHRVEAVTKFRKSPRTGLQLRALEGQAPEEWAG